MLICLAGKFFTYCCPYEHYWTCTGWMFEGWKYTRETCSRKMCSACLPIGKGYFSAGFDHILQRFVNFSSDPVFKVMRCRCDSASVSCFAGPDNVQAAQKFITGLDARRISKLSEHRYISVLWWHISLTFVVCLQLFVPGDLFFFFFFFTDFTCLLHLKCSDDSEGEDDSASGWMSCFVTVDLCPSQEWNYRKYGDKCGYTEIIHSPGYPIFLTWVL